MALNTRKMGGGFTRKTCTGVSSEKNRTIMITMPRDHGNDYSDTEIKDDEALLGLDALQRMPR